MTVLMRNEALRVIRANCRQTAPYSPDLEPDIVLTQSHFSGVDETLHTARAADTAVRNAINREWHQHGLHRRRLLREAGPG
jgi:hypothetical protein